MRQVPGVLSAVEGQGLEEGVVPSCNAVLLVALSTCNLTMRSCTSPIMLSWRSRVGDNASVLLSPRKAEGNDSSEVAHELCAKADRSPRT